MLNAYDYAPDIAKAIRLRPRKRVYLVKLSQLVRERQLTVRDRWRILERPYGHAHPSRDTKSVREPTKSSAQTPSTAGKARLKSLLDGVSGAVPGFLGEEVPKPLLKQQSVNAHASVSKTGQQSGTDSTKKEPDQSCAVCFESLTEARCPRRNITKECTHEPAICLACLKESLAAQEEDKTWNEMECPLCSGRLEHQDMKDFAPKNVFQR